MKASKIDPFLLENLQFFKHVRLFFELNDEQVKSVLKEMKVEKFPPDFYLMKEGSVGDKMFILIKGRVEISKSLILPEWLHMFDKQEKSLLHFSEKDFPFFGEMVMLGDNSKRSASIITKSECVLASLSKVSFDRIVETDASLGKTLFKNMACELSERLRKANRDILKLTTALSIALKG
ncbi:MAG TPA: cyclic nucleotide-binding domain-containing protein [Caldithrix abyssi]|uniref:Cyclic nucleotide-binding domain-containing protein n=1 Tax=Caldithrix abyssi TaxID=187145 RepID=A0A7V5H2D9_CALAY|nr:cyclic nucleotide-binding domain-containing protein [Caldisericaceae bacterium]HHE54609.1 cyclic nucleotide-binding domain-containing protein [Caldithrix abyssi]